MQERVLTKLMDISATARLDLQESTVKLVSTPLMFECLINMTNHVYIYIASHGISSCKGPPITRLCCFSVLHHSKYIKIKIKTFQ